MLPPFLVMPLAQLLADLGFHQARSDRYLVKRPGCVAGIEFVATKRHAGPGDTSFVIHLWVRSLLLARVFGPHSDELPRAVGPMEAHWFRDAVYISERAQFKPGIWVVHPGEPAGIAKVLDDVRLIVPQLERRASDRALADEWAAVRDDSLSEARQAAYLSVLFKARGKDPFVFETLVREFANVGDLEAVRLAEQLDAAAEGAGAL